MTRLLNSGLSAHRARKYTPQPEQPVSGPQTESQEPQTEIVPEGMTKVDELLEWVNEGDVAARAQAVLTWETEKPEKHQRKTLVQQLAEQILEA